MKEDPKLKAAFELKKKIEEDLGLTKKGKATHNEPLTVQVSSYNLNFNELSTFSDLYDFADFDISDEKLSTLMGYSSFEKKEEFVKFLKEDYDWLVESLKKGDDPLSSYNLFLVFMSAGNLKEALKTAIELKNSHPLSRWGYLALSHVLFFLEDKRWQDSFKIYLSMNKDKISEFVWETFKGTNDVKFPRLASRKYLLEIAMLSLPRAPLPKDVLMDRVCAKAHNPCSNAFCKIVSVKSGAKIDRKIKNPYCYLERYAVALSLYVDGEYSKALLTLPKTNDPNFLYLEGLCHYSLDEPDGFNAMMKEISKIDSTASFFISLSSEVVRSFGLADESSAILRVDPSKLEEDYYSSLRKLMFEVARVRGYSPTKVNFGMKIKRYHLMRMFFGYRSCKGVHRNDDKK